MEAVRLFLYRAGVLRDYKNFFPFSLFPGVPRRLLRHALSCLKPKVIAQ